VRKKEVGKGERRKNEHKSDTFDDKAHDRYYEGGFTFTHTLS